MGPPLDEHREPVILGHRARPASAPRSALARARRTIDPDNLGLLEVLSNGRRRLRPAVHADVAVIASTMRPADVAEIKGLDGGTPSGALYRGFSTSLEPMTVELDGQPVAMYGAVAQAVPDAPFGVVWMLGAEGVAADARWFLVASRAALTDIARPFEMVGCLVDERYERSLRWLVNLGFYGPDGGVQLGYAGLRYRWLLWQQPTGNASSGGVE
jgi:hypothetical protein